MTSRPLFDLTSPAWVDVPGEDVEAATADVPLEAVEWIARALTAAPVHAEALRRRDTQLRCLRRVRDAALDAGVPVATLNNGYQLGGPEVLEEAAQRCARQAVGLRRRAVRLAQRAQALRLE